MVSSNLNSKLLKFHCVRPKIDLWAVLLFSLRIFDHIIIDLFT
jgi:hypothetical protein